MSMLFRFCFLVLMTASLTGCVTQERCYRKFGGEPQVLFQPVRLTVPPDSITARIAINGLPLLLPGEKVVVESPESRARITYWKSKYEDALMIQADCDSILILDTIRVDVPTPIYKPIGRKEALLNKAGRISLYVVPVLLFVITLIIRLKP